MVDNDVVVVIERGRRRRRGRRKRFDFVVVVVVVVVVALALFALALPLLSFFRIDPPLPSSVLDAADGHADQLVHGQERVRRFQLAACLYRGVFFLERE